MCVCMHTCVCACMCVCVCVHVYILNLGGVDGLQPPTLVQLLYSEDSSQLYIIFI